MQITLAPAQVPQAHDVNLLGHKHCLLLSAVCCSSWQIVSDAGTSSAFCLQADKYKVPRICFVNKMDRMGADFFNTVNMIVSNLAASPCVLQVFMIRSTVKVDVL